MANYLASGQINIAVVGTAERGPTNAGWGHFKLRAHPANGGYVFIGNDGNGDVTSANGYALSAGQETEYHGDLGDLYFDTSNAGDDVCWFKYTTRS